MKIYWTHFSQNELKKIFSYYKEKAGEKTAQNIVKHIVKETLKLSKQTKIGQTEELLLGRNTEFRFVICKNYKIIYWINLELNQIEIVDVFDTRQNPLKLDRNK